MSIKAIRSKAAAVLLALLLPALVTLAACQPQEAAPPPGETATAASGLASTLVPDVKLDIYVYFRQDNPIVVPKSLTGTPFDVVAESLALWGIAAEDGFALGGGIAIDSEDHAAIISDMISSQEGIWLFPSGSTIYFVRDSGSAAKTLKDTISRKAFRQYDDKQALAEVARLPDGGTTLRAATAIASPSDALISLIARSLSPEGSTMINVLFKMAMIQVVTAGLYSSEQIEFTQVLQAMESGTLREADLGVIAAVKSGLPGFVVSPIAGKFLENYGYTKTDVGGFSVYKGSIDTGLGQAVPVLIRVEGNRIFAAIAPQEAYAETLIKSIKGG